MGITQDRIAAHMDVSQGAVAHWLSGRREPNLEVINGVLKYLGLPRMEISMESFQPHQPIPFEPNAVALGYIAPWDDDTPLDDDEVEIPLLKEVRVAAGSGQISEEFFSGKKIRMGKYTLRHRGVNPDDAVCVTVAGNSMEPALPDGSTVGMDMAQTSIKDGKVYVIKHDGELRVKQVYRRPGGGIRLRSFNQAEHPDEEYTPEQMLDKDIRVVGKVFWSSVLWD